MSREATAQEGGSASLGTVPFCVQEPFDEGDIILRSYDGFDFRVYRIILSLASQIFTDMFGIPQPSGVAIAGDSQGRVDGLPVIQLTEKGTMLDCMLRLCYPVENLALPTFEDVRQMLEVGRKYEMQLATQAAIRRLRELARDQPVRAWVVAMRQDLPEEARYAARMSLRQPLLAQTADEEDLVHVNGQDFHRLLAYHRACSTAVVKYVNERPIQRANCRYCFGRWEQSLLGTAEIVLEKSPAPDALVTLVQAGIQQASDCQLCRRLARTAPRAWLEQLGTDVNEVISQARESC